MAAACVGVALAIAAIGCERARGEAVEMDAGPFVQKLTVCGPTFDPELAALQAVTGACKRAHMNMRGDDRVEIAQDRALHGGRAFVVTLRDLTGDSVRDERFFLELVASVGGWRVATVRATHRCWPTRGHEVFAAGPCS